MSLASVLKKAPIDALKEYVAGPRPTTWTCGRCNRINRINTLCCAGPGCGGLGTKLDATDSPEIWDAAKVELERRRKNKK